MPPPWRQNWGAEVDGSVRPVGLVGSFPGTMADLSITLVRLGASGAQPVRPLAAASAGSIPGSVAWSRRTT